MTTLIIDTYKEKGQYCANIRNEEKPEESGWVMREKTKEALGVRVGEYLEMYIVEGFD